MQSMRFSYLSGVLEQLEKVTSGNKMREILSGLLKKNTKENIEAVSYLVLGLIDAEYKDVQTGMADKMVLRAIAVSAGINIEEAGRAFKQKGDIGLVAEKFRTKGDPREDFIIKGNELSVNDVLAGLRKIASTSGKGSQEKKINILASLLRYSSPKEAKYICRICLGTLRLGVAEMTVLDALSIAFSGTKKLRPELEKAYNNSTDIGFVAKTLATKGINEIRKVEVSIGKPIKMMLAQRVKKISEILDRHRETAAEEKYDGERMQIHKNGNNIIIYSRRLENITHQYPDVVGLAKKQIKARQCIVEGECVAVDEKGNIQHFQLLMQRKRKHGIAEYVKKVPVAVYLFDLLYLNEKSYLNADYVKRTSALKNIVKETKGFGLARKIITSDADKIEGFFLKALERGCEGIIAKSISKEAVYKAGARAWLWIKWKKEYSEKLRDTFDLVVVGAYFGRGKRSGVYGALLCAAYNDKKDLFETLCRLGIGFTDNELAEMPKMFAKFKITKKHPRIDTEMKADVWFEPKVVIEVLGAELTLSPIHSCAKDFLKGKGLALRFPRLVKFRNDKSAEQATTSKEVQDIYRKK